MWQDKCLTVVAVCCSKLSSGDTLLVLASRDFASKIERSHEFLMVTTLDPVTKKPTLYDYVPLALFAGMIAWVVGTDNKVSACSTTGNSTFE